MNCIRQSLYRNGFQLLTHPLKQYCTRTVTAGKNLYSILGIDVSASDKDIKTAYYQLSKKYHPDTNSGGCSHKFQELTEAYETLKSGEKRRDHDREIRATSGRTHYYSDKYNPPVYEYYGFEQRPGSSTNFYKDDFGFEQGQYQEEPEEGKDGGFFHWTYYYDPDPPNYKSTRGKVSAEKERKRQLRKEMRKKYKDPTQFEWWPKLYRCIMKDKVYADDIFDLTFTDEELEIIKLMLNTWVKNETKKRKRQQRAKIRFRDRVMSQEEYDKFIKDILF